MNKLKVMTIVGTRPEIIRLSSVIKACDKYFNHILVHTGQNWDYTLNQVFFEELELNGFPKFEGLDRVFTIEYQREDQQLIEEKVIYSDGTFTINRLWVWYSGKDGWKVLNLVE